MATSAPSANAQQLNSRFNMMLAKLQDNLKNLKIEGE